MSVCVVTAQLYSQSRVTAVHAVRVRCAYVAGLQCSTGVAGCRHTVPVSSDRRVSQTTQHRRVAGNVQSDVCVAAVRRRPAVGRQ